MLEKLRNKRKDKKGFTLVELIVVLIILAILAALLIPALTGYIDKAKDKQIIAETRQAVMAAQTLADEEYAKGVAVTYNDDSASPVDDASRVAGTIYASDIMKLGEVTGKIEIPTITEGKIMSLVYTKADKKCTYTPATGTTLTEYEVEPETP